MYKRLVAFAFLALALVAGYFYSSQAKTLGPRDLIDSGVAQVKGRLNAEQETLLKVQLAISDYMTKKGRPPSSLAELVPTYFDAEPRNPVSRELIAYSVIAGQPKLGAQVKMVKTSSGEGDATSLARKNTDTGLDLTSGFVNPNTLSVDEFTYDKTSRRDPFKPYDLAATPTSGPAGTLTSYSLGQLRMTGAMAGPRGEVKAIVADDQGKSYVVSEGMAIGKDGGVIVSIEEDRISIVETKVDFTGKETKKPAELKINAAAPSGKIQATDKKKNNKPK